MMRIQSAFENTGRLAAQHRAMPLEMVVKVNLQTEPNLVDVDLEKEEKEEKNENNGD